MLKNLVKKFKSHTLNEEESVPPTADERQPNGGTSPTSDYASPLPPPPLTTRAHALQQRGGATLYTNNNPSAGDRRSTTNHRCCQNHKQQRQHHTRGVCSSRKPCSCGSSSNKSATLYTGDSTTSKRDRAPSTGNGRNAGAGGGGGQAASADDRDSGTESDEELARAETNSSRSFPFSQTSDYYASQQSLSASCRSSHCGSPLFGGFSDQECNSLDSVGCESGIGLRSNDFACCDLLETPTPPELPNHHYHTRQQFQRFLKQQIQQISSVNGHLSIEPASAGLFQCVSAAGVYPPNAAACATPYKNNDNSSNGRALTLPTTRVVDAIEDNDQHQKDNGFTDLKCKSSVRICMPKKVSSPGALSGSSVDELEEINGGNDSTTLTRSAKDCSVSTNQICKVIDNSGSDKVRGRTSCQQEQSDNPAVICSEKRKWSQVRGSVSSGFYNQSSNGIINNNNIIGSEFRSNVIAERQALTAARKTPIKLLIPLTRNADIVIGADGAISAPVWDIDPIGEKSSPRKKCRPSVIDEEAASAEVKSNEDQTAVPMLPRRCRPSLNFEKMREKLVKRSRRKRQHCVNTAMKAKLRGWTPSYQLRSFRNDCLFQPLEPQQQIFSPSPPSPSYSQHLDNNASSSNFASAE